MCSREDQVKAKKNCTTSKCSRNVGDRTVAHPHSQQGIGLGGCVFPGPGASKQGGRQDLHKIWSERDLDTSNMQCRGFRHLQSLSKHCSTLGLGVPVPVLDPPVGSAHLSPSLDSDLLLPQCHLVYLYNIFYIFISIKR